MVVPPLQPCKGVAGRRYVSLLAFSIERDPNVSSTLSHIDMDTDSLTLTDTLPLSVLKSLAFGRATDLNCADRLCRMRLSILEILHRSGFEYAQAGEPHPKYCKIESDCRFQPLAGQRLW